MTTTTNLESVSAQQAAPMSDYTRIAVSLATALGVLCFVLLMSYSGPVFNAIGATIHTAAFGLLHFSRSEAVTYETVTRWTLIALYAGVLLVGLAHAKRTSTALAQRLPKTAGKPKVGAGPGWAFLLVMLAGCAAGMMYSLFQADPHNVTTGQLVGGLAFGIALPWVALGLILAAAAAIQEDEATPPTFGASVRVMGFLPGCLITVMGYSVTNIGLLLGLWVMMLMLAPLEKNELPANYPDSFEDASSATPA